jgi:hypothetical protein
MPFRAPKGLQEKIGGDQLAVFDAMPGPIGMAGQTSKFGLEALLRLLRKRKALGKLPIVERGVIDKATEGEALIRELLSPGQRQSLPPGSRAIAPKMSDPLEELSSFLMEIDRHDMMLDDAALNHIRGKALDTSRPGLPNLRNLLNAVRKTPDSAKRTAGEIKRRAAEMSKK